MKLKNVVIKNYRSLKEVNIEFSDLTILIGKNDAGKSNILKALDVFFNWMGSKDMTEISSGSRGSSEFNFNIDRIKDNRIFFAYNPSIINIDVTFELNDSDVRGIFPNEKINVAGDIYNLKNFVHNVKVSLEGKTNKSNKLTFEIKTAKIGEITLLRDSPSHRSLREQDDGTYGYDDHTPNLCSIILEKFRDKFHIVQGDRVLNKEARSADEPASNGRFMPSYLFRLEKESSLNKRQVFRTINRLFVHLFPEYSAVASMEDGEGNIEVFFDEFPSESVGDGIKQGLMNIFNLSLFENKIFAIEEPEIHLHPKIQREIFNFYKEQSKERQIIITTHSPIFVGSGDFIKTNLVYKDTETKETKVKVMGGREDFKSIKSELGARNTDLFFYDIVVFIEGETEDITFPIIADAMGYDLAEQGINLINIRGSGKSTKMDEYLKYLKDSGIVSFIIADGHGDVTRKIEDWTREGLLEKENYKIWDEEFEDSFGVGRVVEAMKSLSKEEGFEFQ